MYGQSDDLGHISRDEYPRLLNGDSTHKPTVEWVIADLATHRIRRSVAAVRGSMSLADELLVMRYMLPKAFQPGSRSRVYNPNPPRFFAAGYEVRSLYRKGEWNLALVVSNYSPHILTAEPIDNLYNNYTVPTLLSPQPTTVA